MIIAPKRMGISIWNFLTFPRYQIWIIQSSFKFPPTSFLLAPLKMRQLKNRSLSLSCKTWILKTLKVVCKRWPLYLKQAQSADRCVRIKFFFAIWFLAFILMELFFFVFLFEIMFPFFIFTFIVLSISLKFVCFSSLSIFSILW